MLPLYVDWKLIDWKEVDSNLISLPRLKLVVLVIPWLVGDGTAPQWSIEAQLGVPWPDDDDLGKSDAYESVTRCGATSLSSISVVTCELCLKPNDSMNSNIRD